MKIKKLSQQQVWNKIARPWKKFREKPLNDVADFLKEKSKKKEKTKILDIGCGSGRHFIKLKNVEFYGIDFSDKMLELAEKYAEKEKVKITLKKASAEKLPFQDNFFDAAVFIASLHCIETARDRKKTLQELRRVLKCGAEAMVTVWNKNQLRFQNKEKEAYVSWKIKDKKYYRYYYLYEKKELENLLRKVGFRIKKSWEKENIFVIVEKNKKLFKHKLYFDKALKEKRVLRK